MWQNPFKCLLRYTCFIKQKTNTNKRKKQRKSIGSRPENGSNRYYQFNCSFNLFHMILFPFLVHHTTYLQYFLFYFVIFSIHTLHHADNRKGIHVLQCRDFGSKQCNESKKKWKKLILNASGKIKTISLKCFIFFFFILNSVSLIHAQAFFLPSCFASFRHSSPSCVIWFFFPLPAMIKRNMLFI